MYKEENCFRRPSLQQYLASILVVDDEIDVGRLFQLYLEESGYRVDVFANPLKALAKFHPGIYDMVLMDVKMPRMNGFELYQRLKYLDQRCKFCFITAFEAYYLSLKEFFPGLDIACYIQKPVTKQKLLGRIAKELML
jgi:two-component system catabolic regulation response regulator CreB/two-component system response regulator ChvI